MSETKQYLKWSSFELEDKDLTQELAAISGDSEAIFDRFYCDLEFGTAGIRGVIGAGTNRMNIYTVRRATQGLADYLNDEFDTSSVAIGYDSRIKSELFAQQAASVLVANGIKVYLYKELMPVPCVSFATRYLKCQAGIMITASHNPAKYNGYKCYGADGCQMTEESAHKVTQKIEKIDVLRGAKYEDFDKACEQGNIEFISEDVFYEYIKNVLSRRVNKDAIDNSPLKLVYTPLNGAGNRPVREALKQIGITNVSLVKEQENPDGHFPTCPYPNPEIRQALDLGINQAQKEGADLLLATDPDCDRVGIAVKDNKGEFVLFTGNEVGALLFDYICQGKVKSNSMPSDPVVVKTIVTTDMIKAIAKKYAVKCIDVLTGFKYIGEQIAILEAQNKEENYLFGFEESYGYLSGTYVRDKDAVVASMLICEMACYYAKQGKTLIDVLNGLYEEYGHYYHTQNSITCEGASGMQKINKIMTDTRQNPPKEIAGKKVIAFEDYKESVKQNYITGEKEAILLPKSNVLSFFLEGGESVILRPSGTEPKIKIYCTALAKTKEQAVQAEQNLLNDFKNQLGL